MFNDLIRNSKAFNFQTVLMISKKFKYSAPKTSLHCSVFHCNDLGITTCNMMQQLFIKRLDKAHVVVTYMDTLLFQFLVYFDRVVSDMP